MITAAVLGLLVGLLAADFYVFSRLQSALPDEFSKVSEYVQRSDIMCASFLVLVTVALFIGLLANAIFSRYNK
jgi:uncharacterized membrane protein YeaQ/YmgE (transglycosylase-associated protein family)